MKLSKMLKSWKLKEQDEEERRNSEILSERADRDIAYDKIPSEALDLVFDMQCYQLLCKIDSDRYVGNIENMPEKMVLA
jgi:hypothetical protein